jgi:hypothetical protein
MKIAWIGVLIFGVGNAFSQSADPGPEPIAILELGNVVSRNLSDHESSFGPTLAVEMEPIKNRLELEAGVTPLFTGHSTEWGVDLLFKKPWTLSRKVEFMAGAGPEWLHSRRSGVASNSIAGEIVLDFMFWPSKKRRFGWYLEPGYEYNFGPGHEHSIGIAGGLLIAIR